MAVLIFTDGSCLEQHTKKGIGGWGYCVFKKPRSNGKSRPPVSITSHSGYEDKVDSTRMEILAMYNAMLAVIENPEWASNKNEKIHFSSDSKMLINGINENMRNWKQKKWSVSNSDLWIKIDELFEILTNNYQNIHFTWQPAHNGHYGNEMAHTLASKAAKKLKSQKNKNYCSNYNEIKEERNKNKINHLFMKNIKENEPTGCRPLSRGTSVIDVSNSFNNNLPDTEGHYIVLWLGETNLIRVYKGNDQKLYARFPYETILLTRLPEEMLFSPLIKINECGFLNKKIA